jgi:RNA polymerase sigma-70 factor (ECF subfamily)
MFRSRQPATTVVDAGSVASPDKESAQDERLIAAAQNGDLPSFNALVTRHERPVYGLCLRMLRVTADAEDATQETFIKAWTSVAAFRGGLFRPWLFRIATNVCYDALRAKSRRPAESLDLETFEREPMWSSQVGVDDPEGSADRRELTAFLERALGELPEDQRLIVLLVDLYGYDYEEAAAISGSAVGTVKSRLSRGRGKLRDLLRDDSASSEHFGRYLRLTNE